MHYRHISRYKYIILLLTFTFLIVALSNPNVANAYGDFNVTVDVSVASISEITVSPATLNWSSVTPGQAGGIKLLDIKNTGSANVTNLYSFITTLENETTRPYGSSNPDVYSAGGVVTFRNYSTSTYQWAGRLEWNWTLPIVNTDRSAIAAGSRAAEGFFRNASVSFYWTIGNGTGGLCNNSGALFAISDSPDDGSVSTRTPSATSITRDGGDSKFSFFSVSRGSSFLNGACVAVGGSCDKMFVYKFDKRAGAFNGTLCNNAAYINAGPFAPNDVETITADAWVPKGLPFGNMRRATWTFVVN